MKAIVVYSGGMDSFTALRAAVLHHGIDQVGAFSLDYGQRHRKELLFAKQVCKDMGIPHFMFDAAELWSLLGNSALTAGGPVPEGHYADESMKQTVVPNRNMILLSLAIGCAVNNSAREVWTGMHAGDHAIYPDCRPEFVAAMGKAAQLANYQEVFIKTPFLSYSKGALLRWAFETGLQPSHYAMTWTCYNGRVKACGKCGACVERLEAFAENGRQDPCEYETPDERQGVV